MYFKQKKEFDPERMGKKIGFALANVAEGFGITEKRFVTTKQDYEDQLKKRTIHLMDALPYGVSVPVFLETTCPYGFVGVWHEGNLYVDGRKRNRWLTKAIGWGESVNGVRVVSKEKLKTMLFGGEE